MIKIYHNPRCKKSRAGLVHLQSKNVEFETIEYLRDEFSRDALKDLLVKLNKKPFEMLRTQEEIYKKQFKGKNFTDDEWVTIMVENPKLIKRPIVVKDYKAVWGDPADEIDTLFK